MKAKKLDPKKNYARYYYRDLIYNMHWYYYSGRDCQWCMDHLLHTVKRSWPWDVGESANALGVCFSVAGTRACMIWTPDHVPDTGIVVHEIFHMMTFLATKMQATMNENNEEFFSQYQEFLFDRIMEVIKKNDKILELKSK